MFVYYIYTCTISKTSVGAKIQSCTHLDVTLVLLLWNNLVVMVTGQVKG